MSSGIHCIVSGQVQGVFFRASTQEVATNLGLSGWVKNRYDGNVELQACGEPEAIKRLQEWLWKGPEHAMVETVRCEIIDASAVSENEGFVTRY